MACCCKEEEEEEEKEVVVCAFLAHAGEAAGLLMDNEDDRWRSSVHTTFSFFENSCTTHVLFKCFDTGKILV